MAVSWGAIVRRLSGKARQLSNPRERERKQAQRKRLPERRGCPPRRRGAHSPSSHGWCEKFQRAGGRVKWGRGRRRRRPTAKWRRGGRAELAVGDGGMGAGAVDVGVADRRGAKGQAAGGRPRRQGRPAAPRGGHGWMRSAQRFTSASATQERCQQKRMDGWGCHRARRMGGPGRVVRSGVEFRLTGSR